MTKSTFNFTVQDLPNTRWAIFVKQLIRKLMSDIAGLIALDLQATLEMILTDVLKVHPNTIDLVDDCISMAIKKAALEQTCFTYRYIYEIFRIISSSSRNDIWLVNLDKWYSQCENVLVNAAPKTVLTQAYKQYPEPLKKKLRELGCIEYAPNRILIHRRFKPSKQIKKTCAMVEHLRASFNAISVKPAPQPLVIFPPNYSVRMTKAQMERMKYNRENSGQEKEVKKTNTTVNKFENTKSRYMEARPRPQPERPGKTRASSGEESRVSPLPSRNARKLPSTSKQTPKKVQAPASSDTISQDSLVTTTQPSSVSRSESQTSNRFGTFTKSKRRSGKYFY